MLVCVERDFAGSAEICYEFTIATENIMKLCTLPVKKIHISPRLSVCQRLLDKGFAVNRLDNANVRVYYFSENSNMISQPNPDRED